MKVIESISTFKGPAFKAWKTAVLRGRAFSHPRLTSARGRDTGRGLTRRIRRSLMREINAGVGASLREDDKLMAMLNPGPCVVVKQINYAVDPETGQTPEPFSFLAGADMAPAPVRIRCAYQRKLLGVADV